MLTDHRLVPLTFTGKSVHDTSKTSMLLMFNFKDHTEREIMYTSSFFLSQAVRITIIINVMLALACKISFLF